MAEPQIPLPPPLDMAAVLGSAEPLPAEATPASLREAALPEAATPAADGLASMLTDDPPAVTPEARPWLPDLPPETTRAAVSVRDALTTRVLIARRAVPLFVVFAVVLVVGALLVTAGAFTGSGPSGEAAADEAPAPSQAALAVPSSAPAQQADSTESGQDDSLLARAARGEADAVKELGRRPPAERNSAESVALARGREAQRRRQVEALAERLDREPGALADREVQQTLLGYVNDPRTAVLALRVLAAAKNAAGPDLLFHVWTATRERTDTTRLAEELLFSKDARANVSPALSIVLELREAEDCDQVRAVLSRAIEHADRRSLVALARLQSRTGCGSDKTEDCYPCLRDGKELREATDAAARRAPPSFE